MVKLMFYVSDDIKDEVITTGLANNERELMCLVYKLCSGLDAYYLDNVSIYITQVKPNKAEDVDASFVKYSCVSILEDFNKEFLGDDDD